MTLPGRLFLPGPVRHDARSPSERSDRRGDGASGVRLTLRRVRSTHPQISPRAQGVICAFLDVSSQPVPSGPTTPARGSLRVGGFWGMSDA